ncbi:lysophospholipid acyltransferase family protein [Gordonia soli]|uniref:Putative acyltransferase n=1 Tax=Gordonia soli NBRC 108243 TaxID=1223545 RepID=M0QQW7_9ACTN|nr:lysophospholipid acyltransferase family protein [Gordonia soli]GAC70968.1 putative acyltransferase [Gordonia soli NBRC 108243]
MEPVYRSLEIIAHSLVRAQGLKLTFSGVENIPKTGGVVLAVNHTSYVDFLPAALGVYRAGRRTRYMIKSEVMDIAIMRFLVNHTKTVPVDRSKGGEAYQQAVERLREGLVVAVYPESTISRSFELKEFKTGAARMAKESGAPIVPSIVWGAHRQWTKTEAGTRNIGRSKLPVSVRYGPPISVAPDADPDETTVRLRTAMTELLHQVQDEYGDHPAGEFWVPARLGGSAPTPEAAAVIEDEEAARKAEARAARHPDDHTGHEAGR